MCTYNVLLCLHMCVCLYNVLPYPHMCLCVHIVLLCPQYAAVSIGVHVQCAAMSTGVFEIEYMMDKLRAIEQRCKYAEFVLLFLFV